MARLGILMVIVFLLIYPLAYPAGGDLMEFKMQFLDLKGTFILIETAEKNVLVVHDIYESYSYIHFFLVKNEIKSLDLVVILGREDLDGHLVSALAKTFDIKMVWAMDHEVVWSTLTVQPLTSERKFELDKNSCIRVLYPPVLEEVVEERGTVIFLSSGSVNMVIVHNLTEREQKVFFRLKPELKADVVILTDDVTNSVALKLIKQLEPEILVRSGEHIDTANAYYPFEQGILKLQTDGLEVFLSKN